MTEFTVTQYRTGERIAVQDRSVPADLSATIIRIEQVQVAILDGEYDDRGQCQGSRNEVIEVTFPKNLSADLSPAAVRFLDGLFGEGFVSKATSKFATEPGWEASLHVAQSATSVQARVAVMEALRTLVIDEHRNDLRFGQVAHLTG